MPFSPFRISNFSLGALCFVNRSKHLLCQQYSTHDKSAERIPKFVKIRSGIDDSPAWARPWVSNFAMWSSLCRSQVWEKHQWPCGAERTKCDGVQFYSGAKTNVLQMNFSLIKLCSTRRQINDKCWAKTFKALKAILWQDFKMFSSKRILFKTASIDSIML